MDNKSDIRMPSLEELEKEYERVKYIDRYRRSLRSTIAGLVVVAAVAVLIAMLVMPVVQIYGSSMNPTLTDGEILVSLKTSRFERGDIIAFYYGNKLLVKRVIGEPGDVIDIDIDGNVTLNGEPYEEPYVSSPCLGESDIDYPYEVPEERWFIMGDNREVSIDSRSTQIGCVSQDQVFGKVFIRVWPLNKLGTVK